MDKFGPKVLADLPHPMGFEGRKDIITIDDFALIDELSGLNFFLENFMKTHNISETVKDRIRARMLKYSGAKPKEYALQELRIKIFGDDH